MHKRFTTFGLAALLLTTTLGSAALAQKTAQPTAAPAASTAQKGFITGVVTNERGEPLAGVQVVADNTMAYNSNAIVYTDAQGRYKIDVSKYPFTFQVTASLNIKYDGFTASVDLVPENPQTVAGGVGGVRNFVYKPKPTTRDDPYGNLATVYVERAIGEYDVDPTKVLVTLTPVGKLADGSTPKPRTATPVLSGGGPVISNVMWGTYKVTATLNGRPLEVRRRIGGFETYPWGMAYTGGFTKDYHALKPTMFLEVRLPKGAANATTPTAATSSPGTPSATTPSSSAAMSASIGGTLRANVDLKGAVVVACIEKQGECDEDTVREKVIATTGRSASYEFFGLRSGTAYSLFAWKDMNGDDEVNSGDLIGMFGADEGGKPVTVPNESADLTLVEMP